MLRKYLSNIGILFAITATILGVAPFAHAYSSPGRPSGYVNDFANVIPAADRASLEAKLLAFENSTGDEIAVVTVSSLGGDTIENYAVQLFQEWGIGKKGKDNGILILVAPNEREARIEVGYGLEGDVTDLQSGNIIRKVMIPAFKENNYAGGISGAADAVMSIITNSPDAERYSERSDTSVSLNINWGSLFVAIVLFLNILGAFLGRTKSWWLGGVLGGIAGTIIGLIWGFIYAGAIAIPGLIILGLLFDFIVSKRPPGSGPGGRGGMMWPIFFGGGRGGSSGGFGGFGGGMSGGGGASGRW